MLEILHVYHWNSDRMFICWNSRSSRKNSFQWMLSSKIFRNSWTVFYQWHCRQGCSVDSNLPPRNYIVKFIQNNEVCVWRKRDLDVQCDVSKQRTGDRQGFVSYTVMYGDKAVQMSLSTVWPRFIQYSSFLWFAS